MEIIDSWFMVTKYFLQVPLADFCNQEAPALQR
jgi:hypothetical protein